MRRAERWLVPTLLCVITATLVLPRLGQRPLWYDEAETGLTARALWQHGVPMVCDDQWLSSFWQMTAGDSLVNVRVPWLQFYIAAASFSALGISAWAARFPFALAAIACVPCLYGFTLRLTSDRFLSLAAGLLCSTNVVFLLFARQSRYYPLVMLLAVLLCWSYVNLCLSDKWSVVLFTLCSVLMFYSSHLCWLSLGVGLAVGYVLLDRTLDKGVAFGLAVVGSALLVFPWLWYTREAVLLTGPSVSEWIEIVVGLLLYYFRDYAGIGLFPLLLLPLLVLAFVVRRDLRKPLGWLLVLVVVSTVVTSCFNYRGGKPWPGFVSDVRYQSHMIPLFALVQGACCAIVVRWRRWVGIALVVILIGSSLLWWPVNALQYGLDEPRMLSQWSPLANYLYEITHDVKDPVQVVIEFLNEHASVGDQVVVFPQYMAESVAFHTKLYVLEPPYPQLIGQRQIPSSLSKVNPRLTETSHRLRWVVVFKGHSLSDLREPTLKLVSMEFEPVAYPSVCGHTDLGRPELWVHAFRTVEVPSSRSGLVIYQRRR